ncbi:MAG: glutathione peroxidase [Bradyrhizobiaceae bacterium]|nr:glutathione peroxidase [Bradyrhizobiaceae bacterium]
MTSVYDYTATSLDGIDVALSDFRGKVMLIVNTASRCGFTPQYFDLQELYKEYKDRGLVILAFPCNQFGRQEPGLAAEIGAFCHKNYGLTFPVFGKIEVNGAGAHPLYEYLKNEKRGLFGTSNIKWNFTKFLIDRAGRAVARFAPTTTPRRLRPAIEKLL